MWPEVIRSGGYYKYHNLRQEQMERVEQELLSQQMNDEGRLELERSYNFNSRSGHVMIKPGVVDYKGKYWKGQIVLKKSPPKIVASSTVNPLQSQKYLHRQRPSGLQATVINVASRPMTA